MIYGCSGKMYTLGFLIPVSWLLLTRQFIK